MLDVRYSTRFKKDFKTCVKRDCKMPLLQQAIDTLRIPATLSAKNNDHLVLYVRELWVFACFQC